MPLPSSTPREEAGSLTLAAPPTQSRSTAAENAKTEILKCGGNVQLMEARLCQITSSMRALIRSNKDLREALDTTAPEDPDFLQAVAENELIVRRQGHVAVALVQEMQAHGCNVDLEEDIKRAVTGDTNGITAVIFGASTQAEQPTETAATNTSAEPAGMFL